MFCTKCGKEIDEGAAKCPHCGAEQSSATSNNHSSDVGDKVRAAADKAAQAADMAMSTAKAISENKKVRKAVEKTNAFFTFVEDGRFLRWTIAFVLYALCAFLVWAVGEGWIDKLVKTDCESAWTSLVFFITWGIGTLCLIVTFWYLIRQTWRILSTHSQNIHGGYGVALLPILARFLQATSEALLVFTITIGATTLVTAFLSPLASYAFSIELLWETELTLDPKFLDFSAMDAAKESLLWPIVGIVYFLSVRFVTELSVIFLEILANVETIRVRTAEKSE